MAKQGFTIVELMVGMLVSAMLALVVGTTLVFTYKAWVANNISVKSQNDYTISLELIGKAVRESRLSDIRISGKSYADDSTASGDELVLLANDVRPADITVRKTGDRLVVQPSGLVLVEEGLVNVDFEFDPKYNTVEVAVQIARPGQLHNTTVFNTYSPRN